MLGTEGTRHLHLYRLRGRKNLIKASTLTSQRLVTLVRLIRDENRLGLAMRSEGNRLGPSTLTPEPGKDARQPCPDF